MSNNNATNTEEFFDILDTGNKRDNSRGCNAHTVINNIACRLRPIVLSVERVKTDTSPLAKGLQALLTLLTLNRQDNEQRKKKHA